MVSDGRDGRVPADAAAAAAREREELRVGDERARTLHVIEVERDDAMRDLRGHRELRIVLDAGEIGGRRLLDCIDIAG